MDPTKKQLMAVRADLYDTAAQILDEIKDKSITHIIAVTAKHQRLASIIMSYNTNHEKIVLYNAACANDEDTIPNQRKDFDSVVDAIQVTFMKLQERVASKAAVPATQALPAASISAAPVSSPASTPIYKPKLPAIRIPVFRGAISQWADFIVSYDALIHTNASMTPVEKFHQLRSLLEAEPLALISQFTISEVNYPLAYRKLHSRYQNDRILATHYANEILSYKTVPLHNNLAALELYFSAHNDCIKRLTGLSLSNDFDFLCFHIAYNHLDRRMQERFDEAHPPDQIHTHEELMKFVQTHMRSVELHQFSNLSLQSKPSSTPMRSKARPAKPSALLSRNVQASALAAPPVKYPCPKCGDSHFLSACAAFSTLTSNDKMTFLKQQGRCFVCLGKHSADACRSRYFCSSCKGRHHILLHDAFPAMTIATPPNSLTTSSVINPSSHQQVMLTTAIVYIKDQFDNFHSVRALLDSCSEISVITQSCARRLGLRITRESLPLTGIGQTPASSNGTVHFSIHSKLSWRHSVHVNAYVMERIAGNLPSSPVSIHIQDQFSSLQLADPDCFKPGPIDLLLGADIYAAILGSEPTIPGKISAISTIFGYVLMGSVPFQSEHPPISLVTLQPPLEDILLRFWKSEEVNVVPQASPIDAAAETAFSQQFHRTSSGRFVVPLLFRDAQNIGNNRSVALRSYLSLERRLLNNPEHLSAYNDFMREYLSLGHMIPAPTPQSYIIPHHVVRKLSSSTTKTRVVFNASARADNNLSLNDLLLPGPKLQSDITQILFSFRLHRVALCGDVRMMYRQILIRPDDRAFQHIFWRPAPIGPICEYELCTVTYGVTSSAFLAQRCIAQLVKDAGQQFPLASQALTSEIYVDDVTSGSSSIEAAKHLRDQLISLLKQGGFELRKWMSNEPSVLEGLPHDHLDANLSFEPDDSYIKILGLSWDPPSDSFKYSIELFSLPCTKRNILSYLARTFDPMGWLAPIVIWIKCFSQRLWLNSLDWDDVIPPDTSRLWQLFSSQLPLISNLRIPRFLQHFSSSKLTLVGFADSSSSAFAACIYFHASQGSHVFSMLIQAKTKVASTKIQSIARLELNAALLLSQLVRVILDKNSKLFSSVHLFSDSENVLYWVSSSPHRYKTYVANRITKIHELVADASWHYVPTADNPADSASRGQLPSEFVTNTLWWNGPSFLSSESSTWPVWASSGVNPVGTEVKTMPVTLTTQLNELLSLFSKYSDYMKLLRILSYVLRFLNLTRGLPVVKGPILVWELDCSLFLIIKLIQSHSFSDDIRSISAGNSNTLRLRKLSPFLDDSGILRVGGRLGLSTLPFECKHPAILPKDSFFSVLIVRHFHLITCHSGPSLTRALIHKRFWLMSSQSLIQSVIRKCVKCIRFKAQPTQPTMGQLPSTRVEPSPPFSVTGTDFAGPFLLKEGRRRNSTTIKSYLCVFVCATTKAVHLELVSSLTTTAFLASFDRFVSRRGCPAEVFSDCGKTFVSANRQLRDFADFLSANSDSIVSGLASKGLHWRFNPPYAPNFGGLYEAAVKSAKRLLYKTLGDTSFYQEELLTLFARIEAILNSRPLVPLPSESDPDNDYLTPGHFLIGRSLLQAPEPLFDETVSLHCRWDNLRRLTQSFWRRFSSEYLNTLMCRSKWQSSSHTIRLHQLVIVPDVKTTPLSWPLGRVIQLHPGPDGNVRVVTVYCRGSDYRRPVNKLVPLPSDF